MSVAPGLPSLESFKDAHQGQRCFVVGNAPSLQQLDLTKLRGELTFTVNRGYHAAVLALAKATYHVVSDPNTYRRYHREIRRADVGLRFYRADVFDSPEYGEATEREPAIRVPFHRAPAMDEGSFATDATSGVFRGFTVLLDAVQLAYTMGCHEVYILGCDLDYHQTQTYFYESEPIEAPRLDIMPVPRVLQSMAIAAAVFAADGRLLANAGVGGKLDSIPRVSFASLF